MKASEIRNIQLKKTDDRGKKKNEKSTRFSRNLEEKSKTSRNNEQIIESLLSPETAKMMSGFTTGQKKIIEKQFVKMMKKIKKQLASPQKNIETFTQRANIAEFTECNSQTARKGNYSDRNLLSPQRKAKNSGNNFSCISPNEKKTKKNWISIPEKTRKQPIMSQVKSPRKSKNSKLLHLQNSKQQSKKKQKPQEVHYHSHKNKNYFLFGGEFVKMGAKETKNYEQQVLLANDIEFEEQRDSELEEVWKNRIRDSEKRKQRVQSADGMSSSKKIVIEQKGSQAEKPQEIRLNFNENKLTKGKDEVEDDLDIEVNNSISINQFKENSSQFQKMLQNKSSISNYQNILTPFSLNEPEKQKQDSQRRRMREEIEKELDSSIEEDQGQIQGKKFPSPLKNIPIFRKYDEQKSQQNQCNSYSQNLQEANISPIRNISIDDDEDHCPQSRSSTQDVIEMRNNVVNIQMKTNKEILGRLLESNKITRKQYQQYLDRIMENYSQQMTEIEKLKDLIDRNEEKVEQMIQQTRNNLKFTEKICEIDANEILDKMFKSYQKDEDCEKQFYSNEAGKHASPMKGQKVKKINQFDILREKTQEQEEAYQTKEAIELRVANQLGLVPAKFTDPEKISTSVSSVYQFLKLFFGFLLKNYKREFLRFINMPYGYSVKQRLTMMQGYEEDDETLLKQDEDGIIYGLDEVLQTEIFEKFYTEFMNKARPNPQQRQTDKIHNQAIFDGVNQCLNEFRPYYHVNGVPYLWSTSEKGLTFFYISEQNIEEVLEKVQIDILRHASSFCGIMISTSEHKNQDNIPPVNPPQEEQKQSNSCLLEQIFLKYTNETHQQLLKDRENRLMKLQRKQISSTHYEWTNFDEYRTALFYQISSLILEELAEEVTLFTYNCHKDRRYRYYQGD